MGLLPDTQNDGLRLRRECFPRPGLQMKQLVGDPGMHHGTCVTHVPWCMSESLTREGGENVPGACATRNFTYLVSLKAHDKCRIQIRLWAHKGCSIYLTLTGELWRAYREYFVEKVRFCIEVQLHIIYMIAISLNCIWPSVTPVWWPNESPNMMYQFRPKQNIFPRCIVRLLVVLLDDAVGCKYSCWAKCELIWADVDGMNWSMASSKHD